MLKFIAIILGAVLKIMLRIVLSILGAAAGVVILWIFLSWISGGGYCL